jgi:hypothetical protein
LTTVLKSILACGTIVLLVVIGVALIATASPKKLPYVVDIANYGTSGILILKIGDEVAYRPHEYYVSLGVQTPILLGRYPSIPSLQRDQANAYGRFVGASNDLPDSVEIIWQLAALSDCKDPSFVRDLRSNGIYPEWIREDLDFADSLGIAVDNLVDQDHCLWSPLSDKVFRRTVDLTAIRSSEAFKRTGQRNPDVTGGRYTLHLLIYFNEDQVAVRASNRTTNPWK